MSTPSRAHSMDLDSSARKRVCKACDRCRLKKSKCDGSSPCSRCKADNTICVFGERKKTHDKPYPKGYTQMLEQQQAQLVAAVQELYHRVQHNKGWVGPPLEEHHGHPLTHDILERLELLNVTAEGGRSHEGFEDDIQQLQQQAEQENGLAHAQRAGSVSSESDHGYHSSPSSASESPHSQTTIKVEQQQKRRHSTSPKTTMADLKTPQLYAQQMKEFGNFGGPQPALFELQQSFMGAQQWPIQNLIALPDFMVPQDNFSSFVSPMESEQFSMDVGWNDQFVDWNNYLNNTTTTA